MRIIKHIKAKEKRWCNKNPIKGDEKPMSIVKKEERDKKARFSLFEIELKNSVDISYPDTKLTSAFQKKKKNKD